MFEANITNEDDSVLIHKVISGDREAFKQLYALYHKRIFAYLLKILSDKETAEEVLNDVMFEVWRSAANFKGQSKLATWIFGIAHNKAMNALRKTKGKEFSELEEIESKENPQTEVEKKNLGQKIKNALTHLSEEHRAVIELTFYHGFSYAEIAEIVDCPVNTVKTRMFHAKRLLHGILNKMGLSK